jgi:short-subunit dehydrogenase
MSNKKVVIITGASSGIGLALARHYAQHNYNVVMAARNKEKLDEYAKELSEKTDVLPISTDVSVEADCMDMVEQTIKKFNRIDILINNAGISMRAMFLDMHLDVMRRLMDVNFWGTVHCTKYALPHLLKTKGSVVGVSSVAGIHGLPARSGYSASKFAMQGFLETLRIEHLHQHLHVLIIAPGFTSSNVRKSALTADGTPQGDTPRKEEKMTSPEHVAHRIYRAVKQRRRFIAISRAGILANLIKKFWPAFLDRMFFRAMKNEPNSPLK